LCPKELDNDIDYKDVHGPGDVEIDLLTVEEAEWTVIPKLSVKLKTYQ